MSLVSIIIPTFNNPNYLMPLVESILVHQSTPGLYKVIIVNNGDKNSVPEYLNPEIEVIHTGKNLGWEGGLKEGLKRVETPYVVFMNDDTYIPFSSSKWLLQMLQRFTDNSVAAVGPSSNCVMGPQNAFIPCREGYVFQVNYLIGFCMMVRKDYLDQVGGVDDSYPHHGDDLDLSMRFRKSGFKLICDKSVFVYHHGFKTGQRTNGSDWNSIKMIEDTNHYLIKKHGLKWFWMTVAQPVVPNGGVYGFQTEDSEGDVVRKYAKGSIVEVGCGAQKTVTESTGIDIVPRGTLIPGLVGKLSIADIVADVSEPLPIEDGKYDTLIARHILEHIIDPLRVLRDWGRVVKSGGQLIIAVPDESKSPTIPLNYQHVHAFTPASLSNIMETLGFHTVSIEDPKNAVSFVGVYSKNGLK